MRMRYIGMPFRFVAFAVATWILAVTCVLFGAAIPADVAGAWQWVKGTA